MVDVLDPTASGSTVPRRQLGRYLRQQRERAGITVTAAAAALEWSIQKIWRTERGMQPSRALDVRNMCELYGTDDEVTRALMSLARETRAHGWWHSYSDAVPEWFELYVGLESTASRIRQYQPELVIGLLQHRAYATAVLSTGPVPPRSRCGGRSSEVRGGSWPRVACLGAVCGQGFAGRVRLRLVWRRLLQARAAVARGLA